MRLQSRPVLLTVLLFVCVVLPLGIVEGWYGRVDYSGDAIPYLDMARAVHTGEWKLAFNPLWGLGYALLIACCKLFFPATPAGEWNAIHLLNAGIYIACYFSFMSLLRTIRRVLDHPPGTISSIAESYVVLAGTALFLSAELCVDTVSRVGPDTLVTTLVLLALGIVLRLSVQAKWSTALLLGLVLGCGVVVKTIFLPLSIVILLVTACSLYLQSRRGDRGRRAYYVAPAITVGVAALVAALFVAPYVAGLSWSYGHFTMGESGSINYAWHVNRLELMHWQGGPSQFGMPLHPTHLLLADPPIYGFSQPFNVSYPPFFNPPYYYQGYRHFFSLKLQLHAFVANIFHLYQALRPLPITYAVLLCLVVILLTVTAQGRRQWLRDMLTLWPAWMPALAGIALYLQVHLEGRYLPAFLLVLSAVPITVFLLRAERETAKTVRLVLRMAVFGCIATLLKIDGPTITAARHHVRYSDTAQWAVARYLRQHGFVPGDPVAVIAGPSNHCTWAHVDGLRIVSELEVSLYAPQGTGENLFWNATPAAQQKMLDAFAQSGAKAVIAHVTEAKDYATPGWTAIPDTDDMIHPLTQ